MTKILALDFGTKRIGYAISDENQSIAFPRATLSSTPKRDLLNKLKTIIKEEGISKIVLGIPLDCENELTQMAGKIKKFGGELARRFMLPIEYIDEFGSSEEADRKIPFRKDRRKKGFKDAISAQIILQRYIDGNCVKIDLKQPKICN